MPDSVFIAFQTNDDSRPIIEAIEADNPHAVVNAFPAMVKIDAVGQLVIRRRIDRSADRPRFRLCANCN